MSAATFTCERCHETFPKAWTDEEALAESIATFGEFPRVDRAVLCDDCYQLFRRWYDDLMARMLDRMDQ